MLTMYSGDEDITQALEAGAVTYLLKDMLSGGSRARDSRSARR